MKNVLLAGLLALVSLALACTGPEGPAGPAGPAGGDGDDGNDGLDGVGDAGPAGIDGDDGADGCDAVVADGPDIVSMFETDFFPAGLTFDVDGTLYASSAGSSSVGIVAPGESGSLPFVEADLTDPQGLAVGDGVLWVCDSDITAGNGGSIAGFDLGDGTLTVRHALPTNGVCTDVIVAGDGSLFATDSANNEIVSVPVANLLTADSAVVYAANTANIFGANQGGVGLAGIATDGTSLFVVNEEQNTLFRVDDNAGVSEAPVAITLDLALDGPHGLVPLDAGRMLVTELNGNRLTLLTLGVADDAAVTVLNTRLDEPQGVAVYFGEAYVAEGQRTDLENAQQPDLPFQAVRFPLAQLNASDSERVNVKEIEFLFLRNVRCPVNNGTAVIHRFDDRLSVDLFVDGVDNGVYTGWWIVMNEPQCLDPANACDPLLAVMWAEGFEVDNNQINITNTLATGVDGPQGFVVPDNPFFGITHQQLDNPRGAWVRYVYKYKGPASADATELDNQINTIGTGCDVAFPDITAEVGVPYCPDVLQAESLPPGGLPE